jgi:hypothetical protein
MKEALSEIGLPRFWQVVEEFPGTYPTGYLDIAHNIAEHVPNGGSEQRQNNDHNDSDQNKDQRVLDQTLSFFLRSV